MARRIPSPIDLTSHAAIGLQLKVDRLLGQALTELSLRDTPVSEAAVANVNRTFGRDLGDISEKAADTADKCPGPFTRIKDRPARMRARNVRIRQLESAKE